MARDLFSHLPSVSASAAIQGCSIHCCDTNAAQGRAKVPYPSQTAARVSSEEIAQAFSQSTNGALPLALMKRRALVGRAIAYRGSSAKRGGSCGCPVGMTFNCSGSESRGRLVVAGELSTSERLLGIRNSVIDSASSVKHF